MKTRFILISAVCVLALAASCQKAAEEPVSFNETATITAVIDDATKTAYENEATFSWVSGDAVRLLVANSEDERLDHFSYYANESGPRVSFTGTAFGPGTSFEQWQGVGLAYYPSAIGRSGSRDNMYLTIPDTYTQSSDNPLSIVPLLGEQDSENPDHYIFKTAVGILKLTFSNVPAYASRVVLYAYDEPIAGEFALFASSAQTGIRMADATGYTTSNIVVNLPSHSAGETMTVYFPVPVGTLKAGACFSVQMENSAELFCTEDTTRDIEVVRNVVKNLTPSAPIAIPDIQNNVDLADVVGTYNMFVTMGPYLTGYSRTSKGFAWDDLVIEASDDSSKGNVMMTKFAGVSGKQYGTYDGACITFPKDQIFGANPYDNAADYPYVALDFYKGSVVDAVLQVNGPGNLDAINADAMGFRACTAEDWQTYGGAYPWALCYSSLHAEFKTQPVKGERVYLKPSMVVASDDCGHDGNGVPGLLDSDAETYWHSNWYYAVEKNDPVYGIYFDITLDVAIDAAQFNYQVRSGNANSRPTRVVIGVSTDGINWTQKADYATSDMEEAGASSWVELAKVDFGGSYKFIRFGIADSHDPNEGSLTGDLSADGTKKCTNLASLELWWAE
ncbi:MAG: discoidin domain-containing protein [Bacteroidales bacterium]|nr:discoidin domain-containing protein [Bacteroidales bacterium]